MVFCCFFFHSTGDSNILNDITQTHYISLSQPLTIPKPLCGHVTHLAIVTWPVVESATSSSDVYKAPHEICSLFSTNSWLDGKGQNNLGNHMLKVAGPLSA